VHGDVRVVLQQGGFQLLDEQALATDFRQWRIQQLVAAAGHRQEGHGQAGVGLLQAGLDVFGLPECQGALARGDTDFARHGHFQAKEACKKVPA